MRYEVLDERGLFKGSDGCYYVYDFGVGRYVRADFSSSLLKFCGVYKLTDPKSGKSYVGGSIDILSRLQEHKSILNDKRYKKKTGLLFFHKECGCSFEELEVKIIILCKRIEVPRYERLCIESEGTLYPNGYNKSLVTDFKTTIAENSKFDRYNSLNELHKTFMRYNFDISLYSKKFFKGLNYSLLNILIDIPESEFNSLVSSLKDIISEGKIDYAKYNRYRGYNLSDDIYY